MIKGFLKGIYSWLRLFPGVVFSKQRADNYLSSVKKAMARYNMVCADSEDYFKERYLKIMDAIIKEISITNLSLKVLDAGCGQGRITAEMAKGGYQIDAIDCSALAIEKAKRYAQEAKVKDEQINWIVGDLPEALSLSIKQSYDLVLCTEVLFMMPENISRSCFRMLAEKTKIGGILLIAVRPRLYYLLRALMYKDFARFRLIAQRNDFTPFGQSLSWFDPADIEKFYKDNGFRDIRKWGIGILSGIAGDPTSLFAIPHLFSGSEKKLLADVEDKYSEIYYDAGRYMVFAGKKTK